MVCSGLQHPNQQVQILKKCTLFAVSGFTQLDAQHSPLTTYHGFFLKAEKPSETFISDEYERANRGWAQKRRL